MDKIEVCKKIKETIRKLALADGDHVISLGTGIVVQDTGTLITANHVIKDYSSLLNPKIIAHGLGNIPQIEYKPFLYNVSFNIEMPDFVKPLEIDLAILEPLQETKNLPFIELNDGIVDEGTEVIMAGFPDEMKLPLHFDQALNFDNPELGGKRFEIEVFFKSFMRLIMMKGGMIGSVQPTNISGKTNIFGFQKTISIKGAVYWIDNASTYGASGGPVVDCYGKLVGIVCEKGMTQQAINLEVPSGSTMALSHKLITWGLEAISTTKR